MSNESRLKEVADSNIEEASNGIVKLLIADHDYMRRLMGIIKSENASDDVIERTFEELTHIVAAHVKAEEKTFFKLIKDNPAFEDEVLESYEEHRIHETVVESIRTVDDRTRRVQQMKIFCEMLVHHIDEEEEDLFPKFKKFSSESVQKKIGHNFLEVRKDP